MLSGGRRRPRARAAGGVLVTLVTASCMVGPDYVRPEVPTAPSWIEVQPPGNPATNERWWEIFQDPVLTRLVDLAYKQNLSLRVTGLRVLQAQARRAVAIGELFPQEQTLSGSYTRSRRSQNSVLGATGPRTVSAWQAGFDAVWELDLWGKFRRAIEAADADLLAAVATYDDVLVSLVAEVAATYVRIRVLDERLTVARDNVRVEHDSLDIARARFDAGGTSELDVQQATALLRDTEATIPQLGIQTRQAIDSLCVLLGTVPTELAAELGPPRHVPPVPATVAVGIPTDLLRRRPDVRQAEQAAAAQSARIGVSVAELLPSFQLIGSIGLSSGTAAQLFEGRSLQTAAGPALHLPPLDHRPVH